MNRVFLLTLLAAAVALAGCSTNDGAGGDGNSTGGSGTTESPPQQITESQAQQLLADAGENMPERFGMTAIVSKGGAEVVRMTGAVDNASGESYFDVKMDPSVFSDESGGDSEEIAATLANGFSFYATPDGMVYVINDTAFAFPGSESGEESFVPTPEESPFGQFLDPEEAFGDFGDNVTVHSVRPITHKGKAAYEIQASMGGEDDTLSNATVVVYSDPARLARIEGDIPADEDEELGGGHAVVEMLYDNEVTLTVPERAKRAAALQYDGGGFSFGGDDEPKTWTFKASGGIPLAEVEAQVKDAAAAAEAGDEGSLDSLSKAPALWSMTLSEGTKTQDGVTLTFTDADGDGRVSAGDTLRIEGQGADGSEPQVVLYDTKTGTYVIPGAGLALLALALAGVALVLRRK